MSLEIRAVEDHEQDFVYRIKKEALGPLIEEKWGWHEDYQRAVHTKDWQEKPWSIISRDGEAIGTVSLDRRQEIIRLGGFYLLPDFQNQGTGSKVLEKILKDCDKKQRDCQVSLLTGNRAVTLFLRHGFRQISEDESHCNLLRNWRYS